MAMREGRNREKFKTFIFNMTAQIKVIKNCKKYFDMILNIISYP